MTPSLQRPRAICAAALLLTSVSCGPRVVVARLASPTAEASRAAATATPILLQLRDQKGPKAERQWKGLLDDIHVIEESPPSPDTVRRVARALK